MYKVGLAITIGLFALKFHRNTSDEGCTFILKWQEEIKLQVQYRLVIMTLAFFKALWQLFKMHTFFKN